MARHPTPRRGSKASGQPDDAFVASVERSYEWARQNQRLLVIAGVLVVALVAGLLYYRNYQQTVESQAATRYAEVQGTIASGNTQLAIRDLQTFVNRFGGTTVGRQARLVLADLLLAQEQPGQALEALGNLPRDLDGPHGLPAAQLQASAHERLGQADAAVQTYLRIADRARFPFQRREALADAARVRMQEGDPEAAAALLARLVENLEANAPDRGYYEMWLAEARAQAQGGAGGRGSGSAAEDSSNG